MMMMMMTIDQYVDGQTFKSAKKRMEARVPMTETPRLSDPITMVPVFKEAMAQQFSSFGSMPILCEILREG